MFKKIGRVNLNKILNLDGVQRKVIFIVVTAIFIFLNLLISGLPLRLDFSNGKAYTLSPATKKIIHKLDDLVTIKFFVSSNLPTRLIPLKNEVTDLLNEYKKESGNVVVKNIDPKKDQISADQAKEAGIPELQFSQLENDKYAVSSSYFGMAIFYGDKKEVLSQVTNVEDLEYNLTASIYKLSRKELVKIGIVGQEQSPDPRSDSLGSLNKILSQQFTLDYLDVSSSSASKGIDMSYKSILVFDNLSKEYDEGEIANIKEYLNKGGRAIFFSDGIWVQEDLTTSPSRSNLQQIFKEYGIKLNSNLVLSSSAELVNFGNGSVAFFAPYPFWVKTNSFAKDSSYFSNISQLTYPWVSSVSVDEKSGIEVKELVKTTKRSWNQTENFTLNPQEIPEPQVKDLKEYLITVEAKNKKNNSAIIVLGSSRFVLERFLGQSSGNLEFALNVLNDLASDGVLTGIRQRAIAFYPLPDLSESQKDIFKYLNILFLPCLAAIYAIIKLTRKK